MGTGSITIGVNELGNTGLGHSFVGFETSTGSIEIHGEPLGGASPGGFYAAFTDSTPIHVEYRSVSQKTPVPHNTVTIAENVPDKILNEVREQVFAEAKAKFGLAQYEVPVVDGPAAMVQNSNTVARWIAERTIELLTLKGIKINPALNWEEIAAGLNLPGVANDAANLDTVTERIGNFIKEFVEDVGDSLAGLAATFGKVLSGESWKDDGSFAGWTNDGWSAEYKAAGRKSGEVATVWQDGVRYYAEGVLQGQKWQAGGDVDKNGVVDGRDKALREIGFWEKQAEVADYDYERKAAAEKAEELRSALEPSNDDRGDGAMESSPRPKENPFYPILLDLDGNGVKITEFNNSTQFAAGKDGLQHRSSWAGAGDGVLFFDPDGRNAITEQRQYVFTDWAPTAAGDLEAIRQVWDSNGDGKLTAADAGFAKFKVMVTNADGFQTRGPCEMRQAA